MARKHYRPEEIIAKLREADVHLAEGMNVSEVCKALGVHQVTYYRWRREFGGMKVSHRLRKAVSDLALDKIILQEAAKGNF